MYFSSPTSNILSTSYTSAAMSRSDSRDSATSTDSSIFPSATSSWSIGRPHTSACDAPSRASHHRTFSSSSSSWTPPPYRSCLAQAMACVASEPSSYLSDDDLLYLSDDNGIADSSAPTTDVINAHPAQKELSTEEQIEMLRQYRQREEAQNQLEQQQLQRLKRSGRIVRFAGQPPTTVLGGSAKQKQNMSSKRRSSTLRRTPAFP